ncbi:uncharacterized protein LOC111279420 [Durio zibethinus]|uniref:Uncharacterized protein LOC111279420 n=1 Tax=Durio zibethinus TaxID=66656 RepID=A0A6P5X1T3_DURZI|nr:uncharacterized protein LOC111279420 [Durio zibethinus]
MEQPSSPGTNPIDLRNCIEELVKFTFHFHLNGTLEWDIGLSRQFCSSLLNHQLTHPISPNANSFGVSQKPLYIQLALALHEIITFGSLQGPFKCSKLASFCQGIGMKLKEEWFDFVHEKRSELAELLRSINFELHVQEPFFTQLKDGLKTIEGKCVVGDYNRIASEDLILFNKCLILEVQDVHHYASFFEMLEAESLAKAFLGVKTIDGGIQVYRNFYSKEKEMINGVVAICVAKVAAQPYLSLARILAELSYEGVQNLLGLAHTAGIISAALPPPKSTLLSSFTLPYNPDVKCSTLTHGARALAKHADRSSDKYWGNLNGSMTDHLISAVLFPSLQIQIKIILLAMGVITDLITNSSWLNVYIVRPHGAVFEIRVDEGYGTCWSKAGTKFIGFLEPLKEWEH